MQINPTKRTALTAALTAMAMSGMGLATVATAQASPPPPPPACTADEVTASTVERPSPTEDERHYELTVAAKPGTVCAVQGTPEDLAFYGTSGPLPVPVEPTGEPGERITLTGGDTASALLVGPATEGPARATSVSMTLPGEDNTPIQTAWVRDGVDGPLTVGPLIAS